MNLIIKLSVQSLLNMLCLQILIHKSTNTRVHIFMYKGTNKQTNKQTNMNI
jgi:hypothetical protein